MKSKDTSYDASIAWLTSIRKRIEFMNLNYKRNSPQCERAGLVWVGKVIDQLARRYLRAPDWPGHEVDDQTRLLWEMDWYSKYCEAVAQLSSSIQQAVKEKRFTLRSAVSRVPVEESRLSAWLNLDIFAAQRVASEEVVARGPEMNIVLGGWPDAIGLPVGAATSEDVMNWALAEGIATESEVRALLDAPAPDAVIDALSDSAEASPVAGALQKGMAQEQAVLSALRDLSYDPKGLPARISGKPGPKSKAWAVLEKSRTADGKAQVSSRGVFDKAWERLRSSGEIAEKE